MESQEFEQQLLECQGWLQNVDMVLSARLEADILASDVPGEYKVNFFGFFFSGFVCGMGLLRSLVRVWYWYVCMSYVAGSRY